MAGEKTFHLVITSVSGAQFDGKAQSVTVPATGGEMTVLAHHEPIVTTLKSGTVIVRTDNKEPQTFSIDNGVLEASGARVTILV